MKTVQQKYPRAINFYDILRQEHKLDINIILKFTESLNETFEKYNKQKTLWLGLNKDNPIPLEAFEKELSILLLQN